MKRKLRWSVITATSILLAGLGSTDAAAQKPGGGSASQIGDNAAEWISDNLTELLVVLVGVAAIATIWARSIGQAVMIVIGGLIAGIFIIEPQRAVSLFESAYDIIL